MVDHRSYTDLEATGYAVVALGLDQLGTVAMHDSETGETLSCELLTVLDVKVISQLNLGTFIVKLILGRRSL